MPLRRGGYVVVEEEVVGSAWEFDFLGLTFATVAAARARDDALRKSGADGLVDVTVESSRAYFYLFTIGRTRVVGDAVRISR